jgi:hypothetical protein
MRVTDENQGRDGRFSIRLLGKVGTLEVTKVLFFFYRSRICKLWTNRLQCMSKRTSSWPSRPRPIAIGD